MAAMKKEESTVQIKEEESTLEFGVYPYWTEPKKPRQCIITDPKVGTFTLTWEHRPSGGHYILVVKDPFGHTFRSLMEEQDACNWWLACNV